MEKKKVGSKFSHWINTEFQSVNDSLPIYRVIYVISVFAIVLPRYLWIGSYPDTFFLPRVGITLFFSGVPDITFFYILNFLLIVSLLALLAGYKTFYSSLAVALFLFIGNAWSYSFGKINHDIFFILIPLLFSVSDWGKKFDEENRPQQGAVWPVPVFALLIGLAMSTAAIAKITTGWLEPSTSALAGHLVRSYFSAGKETVLATYLLSTHSLYLFKFLDYATIIIESAFIFSIFSLRSFRLVCAFACLFHLGVQLTMEIVFSPNILAYAAFVNWKFLYKIEWARNLLHSLQNLSHQKRILGILIISIPVWFTYSFWGNPFSFTLGLNNILGGTIIETCFMLTAAIISIQYILRYLGISLKTSMIYPKRQQHAYKS